MSSQFWLCDVCNRQTWNEWYSDFADAHVVLTIDIKGLASVQQTSKEKHICGDCLKAAENLLKKRKRTIRYVSHQELITSDDN